MTDDEVRGLVAEGYRRISNKYRMVARLPGGKTALEALAGASPVEHRQIMESAERFALQLYLHHAPHLELTPEEFYLFKKGGGSPP